MLLARRGETQICEILVSASYGIVVEDLLSLILLKFDTVNMMDFVLNILV